MKKFIKKIASGWNFIFRRLRTKRDKTSNEMEDSLSMSEDLKCYCNRELSWLKFNERVLDEAGNPRVPLAERLTFSSIYQTNLDEFYMVRVGTLMDQMLLKEKVKENKTNMSSAEQVKAIIKRTKELNVKRTRIYEQLMGELEPHGVHIVDFNKLSNEEGRLLEKYFDKEISPYLSPMVVSKQQPIPFLKGGDIYCAVLLKNKSGKERAGIVPCSNNVFKRLIAIPTRPGYFMLSEELILHFAPKIFNKYSIIEKTLIRITRNADIDDQAAYDEDLDYRDAMAKLIKQRKRLSPVRLEISRKISDSVVKQLCYIMDLQKDNVIQSGVPLDMSFVFGIQDYLRDKPELFFNKRLSCMSPSLNIKENILDQIEKKDVLLSYPFESIRPFLIMLRQAAMDDTVVSIKMTLYRLAKQSKVVDALVEAAENGKEVVVMVELRARFDEENNIEWSRKLEDAGCHVIYGLNKYKVHSKLCLITRKKENGISYITQIGTGNYNEKTAGLYTDLSLMTSDVNIGIDGAQVFKDLMMGNTVDESKYLLVAPKCLQNKILAMMDDEIVAAKSGKPAYIGVKMNSLTDKVIIDKLIEASSAGVKIELIIRGICCITPGIIGKTDNITVISVVGRFLEHSRIYRFGTEDRDKIYIASADFMTRNTVRRVEVATPIFDEGIKKRLRYMFDTIMKDDEKGKILNSKGIYEERNLGEEKLNSQELFYQEAYEAVEEMNKM